MFIFLTVFNIIIILTAAIIGSLLVIKGIRNKQALMFSLLNFATAVWIPANFFGNYATNYELAKILTLADFATGVVLASFFWLFARATRQTINSKTQKSDINTVPLITLSLVVIGLIISGQVVGIDPHTLSAYNKSLYWTYPLIIFTISGLALKDLAIARIKSKGVQKTQTNLMLTGLAAAVLFIVVPDFLLENLFAKGPLLVLSYDLSYLGILIFLLLSSYAIIKHRLFDIRFVIVRSLAYGLSIFILGTAYAVLTFVIINKLVFPSSKVGVNQQVVYTVQAVYTALAIVMAFLFQPLLGFFNRLTQRVFYKNAYRTQDVINKISSVIASTISSKKIQKDALHILNEAVPAVFTAFLLFNDEGELVKGTMSGERHVDKSDIEILQKVLENNSKKMIIYDELDNQSGHLQDSLGTLGISIIAPLATRTELIGYLILGDKKSGDAYKNQDVQLLNIASNQLSVALQNTSRFEKIQDFNVTLQNKIKNATKQLRSTNHQLVAMDEIKDDFINIASHQLRTPLTSIKGYIAMLLDSDFGKLNKNQRQALQEAFTSSQRMVFLISDFLNLSRIKAGRFEIDAQTINLPDIVNEEVSQLYETANSRQLSLNYKPPEKFPEIVLDENKIRQVIMNMIDNAIYYTPKGGAVNIELYATDKDVIFKVKDNGIGVPKADQHKLFTKFYRAENAQRARPDGTGIGMFLAKKIIVAQGGAILFESQENKGSTFGFSFPLSEVKHAKDNSKH